MFMGSNNNTHKNVIFVISKFDLIVRNLITELITKMNLMKLNLSRCVRILFLG